MPYAYFLLEQNQTGMWLCLEHWRVCGSEGPGGGGDGGTFLLWILSGLTWWGDKGGRWLSICATGCIFLTPELDSFGFEGFVALLIPNRIGND